MGRDIADGVKTPIARGFNNIFTALPVFIDMFVKNFAAEFGINSDWSFDYRIAYGTDTDAKGNEYVTVENVSLSEIKPYVFDKNPDASKITGWLVDLIISDWLNAVIDLVNDILTTNNTVTTNIPIITSLLNSLGGFGDTSIITDVLNGFFGLTRTSDYSFELVEREIPLSTDKNARYVGFSSDSAYYLIANIGTVVEIVLNIVNSNSSGDATQSAADDPVTTADEALNTASVYAAAANTSDSSSNVAIDFEKILKDFNAIITQENQQAADELLAEVDSVLSSLLANTYINGFSADQLDNILASVLTFLTNHFGQENANEIVNLLMDYLKAVNAQATTADGSKNANSNGDLDPKKIYSSENLSNLVTRTYVLLEKIINDNLVIAGDEYNCINNAIMGVFSPSVVTIRSDVLNTDLQKYTSWTEISNSKYAKNLGYDFKAGNKEAFYSDLVDSLGAITAIAGALLCSTDYYNNILSPVFGAICKQLNVNYLSSVTADTSGSDVVYGIIETVSNIASEILSKPLTSVMDILKGVIDLMSDSNLTKIINGAVDPIINELSGLEKIVQVISPSFQLKIDIGGTEIVSIIKTIKDIIPSQNILVWIINMISSLLGAGNIMDSIGIDGSTISMIISLVPTISNAQIVLLLYTAAIDIILDPGILKALFGDSYNSLKSLADQLSKLNALSVLNMIKDIISVTQNPSEIYWTFEDYIAKETNSFSFPKGITQADADDAVDSLDELVANVFSLLQSFDVIDQSSLTELVSGLLYKNSIITDIAKAVYGGIENSANGVFSFTPSQFAAYLTDKSYGATYSSTANQLKKYSSWNNIKNINWGFTDGSSKAEQGFINALVALCRPVNDVLAAFLAEGDANIAELVSLVLKDIQFSTDLSTDAMQIKLVLKNNQLTFTFLNKEAADAVENVIKVDISPILSELSNLKTAGWNGYQSAIIPLLEAFMCDNVKTYSQYLKDYNKAKDNLLLDIINPIFGFVDDVLAAPFDTLTKVLPNVSYFLENGGLGQFLDNLLAPLTKIIDVLNKYGLNVDSIIESAAGKSLGDLLGGMLGVSGLKLNLSDLSSVNIHKYLIPIVNKLLKDNGINITLPDIDWSALASLGSQNAVSSAAGGNTIRITANQGQVLVALLRYVETVLINDAGSINILLSGIDAIKNNKTISAILDSIFAQISTANRDEIVLAVFYLLLQQPTNSFFDYSGFKFKEYDFSYPETVDIEFLTSIGPMLDGLINGLIDNGAGLSSLVVSSLYKDDIISSIAVGLYGAVEGVKINDSMNLTQLLAETGIDFSTKNVAALLTDKDYGQKYSSAAKVIGRVNSWSKVNADSLSWGVKDRDTFLHALCAVLRPLYGVLDVLLNDASLGLFNVIYLPGSDGYTSSIVPLMEAFGLYNIKTQYQYREDMTKEYDAILLDILNPLMDKVEDLLNAPIQILCDMLPNFALFFANDGLLQLIENLLAPINALLDALEPIADVNDILVKAGLNINKELSNIGLVGSSYKFDIYDLTASLKPLIGADNIVSLLNKVLGMIDINGSKLGIELMPIDWFQLASHGELIKTDASQASTFDGRVYVKADQSEVLVAVFRYLIETINYKDNYNIISDLIGGLIGDADSSTSDMVNQILEMLIGDTDKVVSDLCELLQALA
ncbi:MAG: hypothetical protein LIO43_01190 [Clostridiales bacterium]|nr:hypothetical protein [Clostridiales bacterium]